MIYAFAIAVGVLAIVVIALLWLVNETNVRASDERKRLEVELFMALGRSEMVSLAISDSRPAGEISYVDEDREYELQRDQDG